MKLKCVECSYIRWAMRLVAAGILLQTLWFKFSGAAESVALFTQLGMEPWGRWLIGVLELVAGICLLLPALTLWGALLGWGLMGGALMSHLLVLGFQGEMATLALLACLVAVCCMGLVWDARRQLLRGIGQLRGQPCC